MALCHTGQRRERDRPPDQALPGGYAPTECNCLAGAFMQRRALYARAWQTTNEIGAYRFARQ